MFGCCFRIIWGRSGECGMSWGVEEIRLAKDWQLLKLNDDIWVYHYYSLYVHIYLKISTMKTNFKETITLNFKRQRLEWEIPQLDLTVNTTLKKKITYILFACILPRESILTERQWIYRLRVWLITKLRGKWKWHKERTLFGLRYPE